MLGDVLCDGLRSTRAVGGVQWRTGATSIPGACSRPENTGTDGWVSSRAMPSAILHRVQSSSAVRRGQDVSRLTPYHHSWRSRFAFGIRPTPGTTTVFDSRFFIHSRAISVLKQ